jgi:hypothetical protein
MNKTLVKYESKNIQLFSLHIRYCSVFYIVWMQRDQRNASTQKPDDATEIRPAHEFEIQGTCKKKNK